MLLHSYTLVHTFTPVFYTLPMIHKENVPGRPIISGCNSPTAKLSIYLDHYLQPILQQIPSYIKNTTHFLRILKEIDGQVPSNSILVTFDVKSLYTNIPHDEGSTLPYRCSVSATTLETTICHPFLSISFLAQSLMPIPAYLETLSTQLVLYFRDLWYLQPFPLLMTFVCCYDV